MNVEADCMRDGGFSTLDDTIKIRDEINKAKKMWAEMRLSWERGRLILEHRN